MIILDKELVFAPWCVLLSVVDVRRRARHSCLHNNSRGCNEQLRGTGSFVCAATASEWRHGWFNDVEEGQQSRMIQKMERDPRLMWNFKWLTQWRKNKFRLLLSSLEAVFCSADACEISSKTYQTLLLAPSQIQISSLRTNPYLPC